MPVVATTRDSITIEINGCQHILTGKEHRTEIRQFLAQLPLEEIKAILIELGGEYGCGVSLEPILWECRDICYPPKLPTPEELERKQLKTRLAGKASHYGGFENTALAVLRRLPEISIHLEPRGWNTTMLTVYRDKDRIRQFRLSGSSRKGQALVDHIVDEVTKAN